MPKQTNLEELNRIITTTSMMGRIFEAWGFDYVNGVKCEYCDEMVPPKTCGGFMPRLEGNTNFPVILCKKDVCMGKYITQKPD